MSIDVERSPEETRQADPPQKPVAPARRSLRQVIIFAAVLILLSAAALILLLTITGDTEGDNVVTINQSDVADLLLRSETRGDLDLELLYAPSWYYEWAAREAPAADGDPTLSFFVFETVHEGELADPPAIRLATEQGTYAPSETIMISDTAHHRVQQLLFAGEVDGEAVIEEGLEPLTITSTDTTDGITSTFVWEQPMRNGLGVLNTTGINEALRSPALSLGAIAAIFGGMLTALSPCLLLLAAYYTAVLSGTAAATATDRSKAERKLLTTGLFFVGGFTAIYTAGGVVAGYVGESVQRFDNVGDWARPVSFVAGVAVVVLGIRMAATSRVPVACKLPGFNRPAHSEGWFGSALMGSTFAVGCLSCFSATVLTALLLYAGATGSPIAGGLVMFMFSAGVGVMFLLAAILVARAAPLSTWLAKAQPVIGGVSAAVMIFFGILMITYKFHEVTGYLFKLWS